MAKLLKLPELVAKDHYMMTIKMDCPSIKPGQFVNIRTNEGTDPLLRRPFSVYDAEGDVIRVVIRVIGRGTEMLCRMEPGEINLLAPLGNGFIIENSGEVLLVGGGVGNAPLLYLARELKKAGSRVTYIYCARGKEYIFGENDFRSAVDELIIATDDGSAGLKGFATDVAANIISSDKFSKIYCCGPDPMMEKTVKLAHAAASVEVSVENYFGCGVGICMGCAVDTTDGYVRACVDGPVLDGRKIIWKNMPD
jgi:dihydroorotate dehydrogenase electron transfer subunit